MRTFTKCRPDTTGNLHIAYYLQPGQLERTQGWAEGDVKRGLRDTFLRLDQVVPGTWERRSQLPSHCSGAACLWVSSRGPKQKDAQNAADLARFTCSHPHQQCSNILLFIHNLIQLVLLWLQALLHVETQPFLKGIAINADRAAAQGLPSRPAEKCATHV